MALAAVEPLCAVGSQERGIAKGDKGSGERRRAKVRCTHIAIIRAHAPNVRHPIRASDY
jgi:hypothetical protein